MPIRSQRAGKVFNTVIAGQSNMAAVNTPKGKKNTKRFESGQRVSEKKIGKYQRDLLAKQDSGSKKQESYMLDERDRQFGW